VTAGDDALMALLAPMRYRLGGRGGDGTIDCLGVTLAVAQDLGIALPLVDPWTVVCDQWRAGGLDAATGFPTGWQRLRGAELDAAIVFPRDGDVWLLTTGHPGVGMMRRGYLWTASEAAGGLVVWPAYRVPKPAEVWRR